MHLQPRHNPLGGFPPATGHVVPFPTSAAFTIATNDTRPESPQLTENTWAGAVCLKPRFGLDHIIKSPGKMQALCRTSSELGLMLSLVPSFRFQKLNPGTQFGQMGFARGIV